MIQIACAKISFDGFGDNDFVRTFELAPQAGYEYIEFNCWYPSTLTPSKMRDLRQRCKQNGLKPAALHVGSFGGKSNDELTRDVCHKIRSMECARELGCGRVVAAGCKRGEGGGIDSVISSLEYLAPEAEDMGVLICLENHLDNNIETTEDYQRILSAVPSGNVGVCIDTGHFDASGVGMFDLIDRLGDRVNHIHLKENRGRGKKVFTRFGEGTTDNDGVVQRAIGRGYSGFLTIELSPEIFENDGRPFTLDDLKKPLTMFSRYVCD